MAEADDREYRARLYEILSKHGFQWVVESVEAQFMEGKPTSRKVQGRGSSAVLVVESPRGRGRQEGLVASEPYSDRERLEVVLDAIKAAVIERIDVENALIIQVAVPISFEPEGDAEGTDAPLFGIPHTVSGDGAPSRVYLRELADAALKLLRRRDDDSQV